MADPVLNGLYPKQLVEVFSIELDAWLVLQPDEIDDEAFRISLTNFIAALPVIPAVAGEYADIAALLAAQPGQTIDVLYRVINPIADPAFNDLPDAEVKSVYYHLPGDKTGFLSDYNSIAFPKLGSDKNSKLGNSLDAFTFDIKFRTAEWSSNQATLQAAANALDLNSPQDLKLTGEAVKLITGNDPSDISRVMFGLDGQLIFEPIPASKIQSDSSAADVTLNDSYQEILSITGDQAVSIGLANIGLTAKSFATGSITSFADAGDGRITVTSATHGLSEGDFIEIVNTSNYDGIYEIKAVPNINDFDITKAFVSTETGDWEISANREIAVDLRVNEISVKEFTRQIEGEGRLNFNEQLSGLINGEDIDVFAKSNTAGEAIEILGTTQSSELKVINSGLHDYKTFHIDLGGGDDGNLGGLNDPFKQPQAAYDAASAIGSGNFIIRIMTAGTYAGLVMDDDNVFVHVTADILQVNLGGLTCTDLDFFVSEIETIGNLTLNQTAANFLGGTFHNCNVGVVSGSVNDQTQTQLKFQGVETSVEFNASSPDINTQALFQAKVTVYKNAALTDLVLDLNTSLSVSSGDGAGNINIVDLTIQRGHFIGNSNMTLTVTGAWSGSGVKYILKDSLIVTGTSSEFTGEWANPKETIKIPLGARDTDHTTGTNKVGLHIDYDFEFIGLPTLEFDPVITDGGPTGSSFIVDINVADIDGTSLATILSTKLSVDAGEFHSSTAATPAVLSVTTIAQYKFISIDFDQIGGTLAGKGGFVTLNGFRI